MEEKKIEADGEGGTEVFRTCGRRPNKSQSYKHDEEVVK